MVVSLSRGANKRTPEVLLKEMIPLDLPFAPNPRP